MSPKRNAPTGRNARAAVRAKETVLSHFPKVCPIPVRLKTTRKKSKPSSVQPARPLTNDASHDSCDDTTGYDFVSGAIDFIQISVDRSTVYPGASRSYQTLRTCLTASPAPLRLASFISEYFRDRSTPSEPARNAASTASRTPSGEHLL